jgi:hypothetical protein
VLADVGFYVSGSGSATQTPCPSGQTTLATGATSCISDADALAQLVVGVGPGSSLSAKASAIQADIAGGKQNAACGDLNAFVNQVNAQTGKSITTAQAAPLISLATAEETALGC